MKPVRVSSLVLSIGLCGLAFAGPEPPLPIHGNLEDVGAVLVWSPGDFVQVLVHEREAISPAATLHFAQVSVDVDFFTDPYTYTIFGFLPEPIVDVSRKGDAFIVHAKWDFRDAYDVILRKCDHQQNCFPADPSDLPDPTVNVTWVMTPYAPSGTAHLLRQDSRGKYEVTQDANVGVGFAEATVLGHKIQVVPGDSNLARLTHIKAAATYPPGFRYPIPPSPQFFCVQEVCDGIFPPN
jgi:hypothetical protein